MPPRTPAGRATQPRGTTGTPQARSRKVEIPVRLQDGTNLVDAEGFGGGGAPGVHNLLSATHGDTTPGAVVRGDLLVGNASALWGRVAKGTAGYAWIMGATDPAWSVIPTQTSALLSAVHTDTTPAAVVRGDVLIGSGVSPMWTRLPKSTPGHIFTMGADEPAWAAPATSGTVTSVGLALPAEFGITGSPVTGAGTLTGAWANQNPHLVFAGPPSGAAAVPTFRSLVLLDLPAIASTNLSDTANLARLDAANSFSLINPLTTIAESWIGPSSTAGIYFKAGQAGFGVVPTSFRVTVAGVLGLTDGGSPNPREFYFSLPGDYGSIQAVHQNVQMLPIALNPAGGNVGIGTSVPGGLLHVKSGTVSEGLISELTTASGTVYGLDVSVAGAATINYAAYLDAVNASTNYALYTHRGLVRIGALGAFAAGDKYVIADASGILHLSATGPAS